MEQCNFTTRIQLKLGTAEAEEKNFFRKIADCIYNLAKETNAMPFYSQSKLLENAKKSFSIFAEEKNLKLASSYLKILEKNSYTRKEAFDTLLQLYRTAVSYSFDMSITSASMICLEEDGCCA